LSNRLIVLKNGKIVDSGVSSEIINNPKDKYSKLLIDSCESEWFINQ